MKLVLKTCFVITFCSASVASAALIHCKCEPAKKDETTHWGGNMTIVSVVDKPRRKMQGIVEFSETEPMKGAFVEIFTHPEYLLETTPNDLTARPKQERIAACRTGPDGKFCFMNI